VEWGNGGMAVWRNGGMAEWQNGRMAGKMSGWWGDGVVFLLFLQYLYDDMAEWRNGRMAEWLHTNLPDIFMVHADNDTTMAMAMTTTPINLLLLY
jgi:hypothetical protein